MWQWLLGIDAPKGTTLESASLTTRGLFPWWVACLLAIPLLVVVIWFYFNERGKLGWGRRGLLVVLRMAILGGVLFLLLRPLLVAEYKGERPRGVVLLIDNSLSQTLKDRRLTPEDKMRVAMALNLVQLDTPMNEKGLKTLPSAIPENPQRLDLVKSILSHPDLKLKKGLQSKGPLRTYLFGQSVTAVVEKDDTDDVPKGLNASEKRTALADAISEILQRNETEPPAAIVLMTDGRDNASSLFLDDVARDCQKAGTALHIWGVGSTEAGLLQIRDVPAPEAIFPEDIVSVPVRWRSRGIKKGTVEVVLKLEGREVARKEVPVKEGSDLEEVLTFTPRKEDAKIERSKLTASIRLKDNAGYKDEMERAVRVEDKRVKLLYIENTPRWEYQFLQMNLLRDRRVQAKFLLVQADPDAVKQGYPFLPSFPPVKELREFDIIIIGDVPASWLGPDRIKQLEDFVKEGGGLVHIAGRQNAPSTWHGTALGDLLPVEYTPRKFPLDDMSRPQAFQPTLTRAGERTPMLSMGETLEENRKVWNELSGIFWYYPSTKLKAGTQVLLAHPKAKLDKDPMPLLSMHNYGKGLVLYLATEETWRWRYNTQDSYFGRFWGQVVYQLGMRRRQGTPQSMLAMERADIVQGQPGQVFARLFDANFKPLTAQRVTATLEQIEGPEENRQPRTITLEAVPDLPGEYRAVMAHDRVGRFALKLPQPQGGTVEYRVDLPPQHELAEEGMNSEGLSEAAKVTGGRFYREEDLHRLVESVEAKKAPFVMRREVLLWGRLSLLVLMLLLTAEWTMRKFSNLS